MSVYKRGDDYRARCKHKGANYNIGTFETHEEAKLAVEAEYARLSDGTSILVRDDLLQIIEYASRLHMPVGTVKRWIHEGMPVLRVGQLVRVDTKEADAWVSEHRSGSISFNRKAVIYFAVRDSDSAIKIGWTSDIERRIRELRKEEHEHIELIALYPGDKPVEQSLHKRFANLWIEREWFRPEQELASYLATLGRSAA